MAQHIRTTKAKTPLSLFFIALFVRLVVVGIWRFDGLYGQDAFAYLQQAIAITENLPRGQLPPADFFWPNGFPLLVAMFFQLFGQSVLVAQLVCLLCGSALAPLAYGLATELFPQTGRCAGILAGLIVATAGQVVLSSVVVMADIPAMFWAMLAGWMLMRVWRQPDVERRSLWLLCTGAALAFAVITRWVYVLLIPAFAFELLYQIRQHRSPWWLLVLPAIGGTVVLLPQLWLSLDGPEGILHDWLLGWRPGNVFQRQFENADGRFSYRFPVGVFYAQPAGHPAYLFPLLGLAAPWGILRQWQKKDWAPLILLLGWSAPVYLFLAGIPYQNFRFGLTLYPPLVLLASFGVSDLWERARWRRLVQVVVLISIIGALLWAYRMLDEFLTVQNDSKAVAHQVEEALPPNSTLLAFGLTLTLQHYTHLETLELFFLDPESLDVLAHCESALYLLLDPNNVERQWRGRAPEVNFRWLREHTKLMPIGDYPPYRLFRVQTDVAVDKGRAVLQCASG